MTDRRGIDTERTPQVLISGAGPTGLLLAVELQRRGVDFLLIDELDSPRSWDRATVVHPRSMEIFEALGLAEEFVRHGIKTRAARFESDGEILGELDLQLINSRYGFDLGLSEEVTERLLTGLLESLGGSVTRGTRLVGVDLCPRTVTASMERAGGSFELETEWLVGCDGLHSVVREQSGIEFSGSEFENQWAVFDATIAGWDREFDVAAVFLETPEVILTPLPDRRWRVYLRPTSDERSLVNQASTVLHRYVPEAKFVEVENPTRFYCHSRVAASYRSGRALLAGDAAHACSPAEGHGMNTGLQDAFNLGWKLAMVCRGEASEALLDTYETERRPVAERIVASGNDAEVSAAVVEERSRKMRDAAIRLVFGDPETSHREAAAAAELDRSYAGSPIVSGESSGGVAAGRLVPDHATVDHPVAGSTDLHQLAHRPGHTVIVLGGPAAAPSVVAELVERLDGELARSAAVEAVFGFSTRSDGVVLGRIDEALAERLGVSGVTLLTIRPDRYVGLRHDGTELDALGRYLDALTG